MGYYEDRMKELRLQQQQAKTPATQPAQPKPQAPAASYYQQRMEEIKKGASAAGTVRPIKSAPVSIPGGMGGLRAAEAKLPQPSTVKPAPKTLGQKILGLDQRIRQAAAPGLPINLDELRGADPVALLKALSANVARGGPVGNLTAGALRPVAQTTASVAGKTLKKIAPVPVAPAPAAYDEKAPWYKQIGRGLASGVYQAQGGLANAYKTLVRLGIDPRILADPGLAEGLDENALVGYFGKGSEGLYGKSREQVERGMPSKPGIMQEAFKAAQGIGGMVPAVAASALVGPAAGMQMFTSQAFGNYGKQAEDEGADVRQALEYATMGALLEAATEAPIIEGIFRRGGKEIIGRGVGSFVQKFGSRGLDLLGAALMEPAQEVIADIGSGAAKKAIYKADMPIVGKEGIINPEQMAESAKGGFYIGTLMGALGLGSGAAFNMAGKIMDDVMAGRQVSQERLDEMAQAAIVEMEQSQPAQEAGSVGVSEAGRVAADSAISTQPKTGLPGVIEVLRNNPKYGREAIERLKQVLRDQGVDSAIVDKLNLDTYNDENIQAFLKDQFGAWRREAWEAVRTSPEYKDATYFMIDANVFKRANDIFGHPFGDQVLTWIIKVVNGAGGETFRVGGDEFSILAKTPEIGRAIMEAAQGQEMEFTDEDGNTYFVPAEKVFSYGEASGYAEADRALYAAKEGKYTGPHGSIYDEIRAEPGRFTRGTEATGSTAEGPQVRGVSSEAAVTPTTPTTPPAPTQGAGSVVAQESPLPESKETLAAQVRALKEKRGSRKAVLVTPGEKMPLHPKSMKTLKTPKGVFIYRPDLISEAEILQAVAEDKIGGILGLGVERKPAAPIGAVTARDAQGVTVQNAVVDKKTLPKAKKAGKKAAGPGGTVKMEPLGKVVAERAAGITQGAANMATGGMTVTAKQPWEMTREEWVSYNLQRPIDLMPNPDQQGIIYDDKLESLREGYKEGANIPPIVALAGGQIIGGHHRDMVSRELGINPDKVLISSARLDRYNQEGLSWDDIEFEAQRRAKKALETSHKRRVEQAAKRGEIGAGILDYPDLVEKYGPPTEAAKKKSGQMSPANEPGSSLPVKPAPEAGSVGVSKKTLLKKPSVEQQASQRVTESETAGPPLGIVAGQKPGRRSRYAFSDPSIEARWQAARGVPKEHGKLGEIITHAWNKMTREFEFLPKTAEFSPLRNQLLALQKQRQVAMDKTLRRLQDVVLRLEVDDFDLFTRAVVMDDLAESLDRKEQIPFWSDAESFGKDKAAVDQAVQQSPLVQEAIKKRRDHWDEVKQNYIDAMDAIGFDVKDRFKRTNYFRHQVLEYARAVGIMGAGKRLKTPTGRSFLKTRGGKYTGDINVDYLQAETEVMAQMVEDVEIAKTIGVVMEKHNIADRLKAEAKQKGVDDWRELIPEGYILWQPRQGSVFYLTDSIPARLAEQLKTGALQELGISADDLRQVMAVGGPRKELVIKEEIAKTLDNLTKPQEGPLAQVFSGGMGAWKIWQLFSPKRFLKYETRNLSGDADHVFVGNPRAFLKLPRAISELYKVIVKNAGMTPEMRAWFERGGMQSTLFAQEISDVNKLKMFERFLDEKGNFRNWPGQGLKMYWNAVRGADTLREGALRYAAYLDYLEQMKSNQEGRPKNFGASDREEVMALDSLEDRAYKLSNDLLGAYDQVSVAGQYLRKRAIPFWSWNEVNFKIYKQLLKNAALDGKSASTVGRALGATVPKTAYTIGKFAIKAAGLWAVLNVWNYTRYRDEEEELPEEVRRKPHIIFGRDKDGKVLYFSRLGAVADFVEWFGFDDPVIMVQDFLSGKKTIKEIAADMAKQPLTKISQGLTPAYKVPFELLTGKKLYPDPFKPGTVRDPYMHIADSLGLKDEYIAVRGLPSRGYLETWKNAYSYRADPEEIAYWAIVDRKFDFQRKRGKGGSGFSPVLNPKSNALYNLKLSIRYGDQKSMKKYLLEYAQAGGTRDGLKRSLDSLHPLYGIRKDEWRAFQEFLTAEEQRQLKLAVKYYEELMATVAPKEGAAKKKSLLKK
jgi:diguanylate cyclase (GGDEF)-like protein